MIGRGDIVHCITEKKTSHFRRFSLFHLVNIFFSIYHPLGIVFFFFIGNKSWRKTKRKIRKEIIENNLTTKRKLRIGISEGN